MSRTKTACGPELTSEANCAAQEKEMVKGMAHSLHVSKAQETTLLRDLEASQKKYLGMRKNVGKEQERRERDEVDCTFLSGYAEVARRQPRAYAHPRK